MVPVVGPLLECLAVLALGIQLKKFGVLNEQDGQTARKIAVNLTLPAIVIQAMCCQEDLRMDVLLGTAYAAICFGVQAASSWTYSALRPSRERAVLAGCGVGAALTMWGYPLVDAFFGLPGIQTLALLDVVNCFAALTFHVCVVAGSYMLFASAGPAFPESFKHEDGGEYRGQWRGMRKEGLGVYVYSSGARYEGEWRDNVKDGRGVYFYPKGGTYEGEWATGVMSGTGVRTFSTGQVKAGRWVEGKLESPLELWQCSNAAEGAADAALAARRVDVGGGQASDALQQLIQYPPFWVALIAIVLNLVGLELTHQLDIFTDLLAQANRPLLLLAAGLTLPEFKLPESRILADVVHGVTSRLIVPLALAGSLLMLLALSNTLLSPGEVTSFCVAIFCLMSPIPSSAIKYTHFFRLNENLARSLYSCSLAVSLPLMLIFGGLATMPVGYTQVASAGTRQLYPLAGFCMMLAVGLGATMTYFFQRSAKEAEEVLTVKTKSEAGGRDPTGVQGAPGSSPDTFRGPLAASAWPHRNCQRHSSQLARRFTPLRPRYLRSGGMFVRKLETSTFRAFSMHPLS